MFVFSDDSKCRTRNTPEGRRRKDLPSVILVRRRHSIYTQHKVERALAKLDPEAAAALNASLARSLSAATRNARFFEGTLNRKKCLIKLGYEVQERLKNTKMRFFPQSRL